MNGTKNTKRKESFESSAYMSLSEVLNSTASTIQRISMEGHFSHPAGDVTRPESVLVCLVAWI